MSGSMRAITWMLICTSILALATLCHAQAQQFGRLSCTVTYKDGTPYASQDVNITIGKEVKIVKTNADGAFSNIFPVGEITVSVAGQTETVTIEAGEITTLTLTAKRTGIALSITYPDNTPIYAQQILAAYKTASGAKKFAQPLAPSAPGRYSLQSVPEDITELSIIAMLNQGARMTTIREQWTFKDVADSRSVSMTVTKGVQVRFPVVDGNDQALKNAQVRGSITLTQFIDAERIRMENAYWDDLDKLGKPSPTNLGYMNTDNDGFLNMGMYPVGHYVLSLRVAGVPGAPVEFDVTADGSTLDKYVVAQQLRTITQIVFDAKKKPVPNTKVSASYLSQGKIVIARATSDANGKVTWKDVPPVRIITWGKKVPAGVIPADVNNVTETLAAPTIEEGGTAYINFSNLEPKPARINWLIKTQQNATNVTQTVYTPDEKGVRDKKIIDGKAMMNGAQQFWSQAGMTFSVVAIVQGSPLRISSLEDAYFPYMDGEQMAQISLELTDGATLNGKFALKNGKPIAGVSKLQIVPLKSVPLPTSLTADVMRQMGLLKPLEKADGTFTFEVPVPGQYRLMVDFYDQTTPLIPELKVDIATDMPQKTITLPDPVLTDVPAGAEVSWLTRNAPADTQKLIVAARTPAMMLFGSKEDTLACWYRPTPDTLEVYNFADTKNQKRTFTLRSIDLILQDKDGNPLPVLSPVVMHPPDIIDGYPYPSPKTMPTYPVYKTMPAVPTNGNAVDLKILMNVGRDMLQDITMTANPAINRADGREIFKMQMERAVDYMPSIDPGYIVEPGYRYPNSYQSADFLRLFPLLPVPQAERWSTLQPKTTAFNYRTEGQSTPLRGDITNTIDVWVGRYLLAVGGGLGFIDPVDVPEIGKPAEIILKIDTARKDDNPVGLRNIKLIFPDADYDALRKGGAAQTISVSFGNFAFNTALNPWNIQAGAETSCNAPLTAKTLTVNWPGVGIIKNVAIPEVKGDETPIVTLPAFAQASQQVSGKIITADGKPYANSVVTYWNTDQNQALQVNTNAEGAFTIKNVQTGTLFINAGNANRGYYDDYPQKDRFNAKDAKAFEEAGAREFMRKERPGYYYGGNVGWAIDVPEDGVKDIQLRLSNNPVQFSKNDGGMITAAWWLPEDGKPVRLYSVNGQCGSHDIAGMPGRLWIIGNGQGTGQAERLTQVTPAPGWNYLNQLPVGPTVGITFPLELAKGLPSTVTLIGKDDMTGVEARFDDIFWQPSPALGLIVGQIQAVPPGAYTARVETKSGAVEADLTVTEDGGHLELNFPK